MLGVMEWLNYHHLRYFWAAAREGGVVRASRRLRVSQPTVSAQIRELEQALGEKLFRRQGRRLVLTEVGRLAFRYADEIFSLGRELLDTLHDRPTGRPARLSVGIANVVPKLIAYRLLAPALHLPEPMHIECVEDRPERLLAELATYGLDLVVADAPVGPGMKVKAFNHLLGECGVSLFASERLHAQHRKGFPGSLDGAPMLLPTASAALRRDLDQWLERSGVRPRVVGEFEDSALMKAFGEAGSGIFPGPTAIEREIKAQYGVRVLARVPKLRERFYAITVERRLRHPGVVAISEAARRGLFA
jgi:LysR family transcriptional regulator, transcriptional activator of nhaA